MELANREGKGGRKIIFDCGRAGFYGQWCDCVFRFSTGYCFSIRRALASDDTNPKPQDHHKANVDSCAALQVIDSFLRNRGGQIRVPGKLGEYQNVFRINVRWESRSSAAAARDHRPERMESWVGTRSTVLHGDETHRRY